MLDLVIWTLTTAVSLFVLDFASHQVIERVGRLRARDVDVEDRR